MLLQQVLIALFYLLRYVFYSGVICWLCLVGVYIKPNLNLMSSHRQNTANQPSDPSDMILQILLLYFLSGGGTRKCLAVTLSSPNNPPNSPSLTHTFSLS